jgi:hypothetical protein
MENVRELRDCDQDARLLLLLRTPTRLVSDERWAGFGSKQASVFRDFRDCSRDDCKAARRSGIIEVS